MKIVCLRDRDAAALLEERVFAVEWDALHARCSWASVFQGRDFLLSWYEAYRSRYEPVIVAGRNGAGELRGLFFLAANRASGELTAAGTPQAEYQAWLAAPEDGDAFIEGALEALGVHFPAGRLELLFVPPEAPVGWALGAGRWTRHCYVKSMPRGLMALGDGTHLRETLRRKKQNKLNRLKRHGDVRLERIDRPEELAALFDQIATYQALRLRAVHRLAPAEPDPLLKTFYLNLAQRGGIVHATALRVGDDLASAQIHLRNRGQALLGLIAHSPFYARHSPGELHLLLSGLELAREAVPVFDLTPGGQYKERFATHHDEVRVVVIFFRRRDALRHRAVRGLAQTARGAMQSMGLSPERAKEAVLDLLDARRGWAGMSPGGLLREAARRIGGWGWRRQEIQVYSLDLRATEPPPAAPVMARDRLSDLLAYAPREAWQLPGNRFLRQAMQRFEAGHHFYSRLEAGRVAQYAWLMTPGAGKPLLAHGHEIALPSDAVLLTDFYADDAGEMLAPASLAQLLRDATCAFGAGKAYVCVPAENGPLREMIERAGFSREYSLFRRRLLGRSRHWSQPASPSPAAVSSLRRLKKKIDLIIPLNYINPGCISSDELPLTHSLAKPPAEEGRSRREPLISSERSVGEA